MENTTPKEENVAKQSSVRVLLPQIIAVMVKNVLLLTLGMGTAYPTILIPALSSENSSFQLNNEQISWIGSINLICALAGCSLSGIVTQPVGRKGFMQVVTVPLFVSWLIFKFANKIWQIYFSLALYGICSGLVEAPVLSYVAEITQPPVRGMLAATGTLMSVLGVLLEFLLGTFISWQNVAAVSSAMPIIAFCLLCIVPESPHWLIMHNKLSRAQNSLAWLRGWTTIADVEEEFQEMCRNHNIRKTSNNMKEDTISVCDNPPNIRRRFKIDFQKIKPFIKKNFLWPFGLLSLICFLTMFSGIWSLQTYAVNMFLTLHVPMDEYYATLILGIAQFTGSVISIILVKCFGKRVMTFTSLSCVGVCDVMIGIYAYITDVKYLTLNNDQIAVNTHFNLNEYQWIPLVFLVSISFFGHCGIRVLPWILMGEIYTHETRAVGCGLTSAIFNGFGFLANKFFLNTIQLLTLSGIYWFYGIISFIGCIILYFTLPETEGKSLQEVIDHFSSVTKLDNEIRKKH